jgi:hypothetical protein
MVVDALCHMRDNRVRSVLVIDEGVLVGIVTQGDCAIKVLLPGLDAKLTPVSQVMTGNPVTVEPKDKLEICMSMMATRRFRHLPVLEEGKVVGVISIGDIVKEAITDLERNVGDLMGYITRGGLDALNARAEPNALAFWHDATRGSFDAYKVEGALRKDIKYTGDWTAAYSDWGLYHDQRDKHWEELDLWRAYGTDWPVEGVFVDGVQLLGLYHRPSAPTMPASLTPPWPPGRVTAGGAAEAVSAPPATQQGQGEQRE